METKLKKSKEIIEETLKKHVHNAYLRECEIRIYDYEMEIESEETIHGIEYMIDVCKVFYKYFYVTTKPNGHIVLRAFK